MASSDASPAGEASTFEKVAKIISEMSDVPLEEITPESHAITDLEIDSLDFFDVVFSIDKTFGIQIPLEAWMEEVNQGETPAEEYFVMKNLCAHIDRLVAEKAA